MAKVPGDQDGLLARLGSHFITEDRNSDEIERNAFKRITVLEWLLKVPRIDER